MLEETIEKRGISALVDKYSGFENNLFSKIQDSKGYLIGKVSSLKEKVVNLYEEFSEESFIDLYRSLISSFFEEKPLPDFSGETQFPNPKKQESLRFNIGDVLTNDSSSLKVIGLQQNGTLSGDISDGVHTFLHSYNKREFYVAKHNNGFDYVISKEGIEDNYWLVN